MARFRDLPEELVVNILAFLPVDSLVRSKCVQKSWYSLISNSLFVVKHLRNQMNNTKTRVLLKSEILGSKIENIFSLISFVIKKETSTLGHVNHVSIVEKIVDFSYCKDIIDSSSLIHCHGIVCVHFHDDDRVILANPSIREFRELPKSRILQPQGSEEVLKCPLSCGFGYDLKSNDYKVIRFLSYISLPHFTPSVKLYTLSTNSWRQLKCTDLLFGADKCLILNFDNQYLNGACYWLARGEFGEKHEYFILSFDMCNEVFGKIPIPKITVSDDQHIVMLKVLNESLAFVVHDPSRSPFYYVIWFLDKSSSRARWEKLLVADNSRPKIVYASLFWGDLEFTVRNKDGKLCFDDHGACDLIHLPIAKRQEFIHAVTYVNSLVSVKAGYKLDVGEYTLA